MLRSNTVCTLCDRPASCRYAAPHLRRRHPRSGPVFDLLRAAQSKSTTETQRGRAPDQKPALTTETRRHGDTEKIGKKQSQKQNPTREQPRTQRKFRGEWKSMKIFVKREDFKSWQCGGAEQPRSKSQEPMANMS